jgi:hypothetical protein
MIEVLHEGESRADPLGMNRLSRFIGKRTIDGGCT